MHYKGFSNDMYELFKYSKIVFVPKKKSIFIFDLVWFLYVFGTLMLRHAIFESRFVLLTDELAIQGGPSCGHRQPR